jgi:hypothetical protein
VLQLKFSFKVVLQLLNDEHQDSSEEDWIKQLTTLERNGILISEVGALLLYHPPTRSDSASFVSAGGGCNITDATMSKPQGREERQHR